MDKFIEKLIGRLEEIESKILDVQYDKTATTNTIERCDAQLRLIEKTKKEVNQLAEEHKDNVMIDGQYCWQTCGATEHCKECNRLCNGSIDYYENYDFMAEEHKGGWIPCSERLPEVGQIVLANVRKPNKYVNKGTPIIITEYEDVYYWRNGTILAWQPLPTPYTEKNQRVDRN